MTSKWTRWYADMGWIFFTAKCRCGSSAAKSVKCCPCAGRSTI